jgi:hypothetical protein
MNRNKVVMTLVVVMFLLSGVSLVHQLVSPTVVSAGPGRDVFDFCNSYWCSGYTPCGYAWEQCMSPCIDYYCQQENSCFLEAFDYGAYYCSSCYPNC